MNDIEYNKIFVDTEIFTTEDAIEAAEKIFDAQEQDFREIKNEKWYKKFINAVSFRTDRKKMIRDIRSLSALQKIFLRMYRDNFAQLNTKLDNTIRNLNITDSVIKRLYVNYVVGIRPQAQVDKLSEIDQEVLKLLLNEYLGVNNEALLKTYRASIAMMTINKGCPSGEFSFEQLEKISSPETFYRCLVEMRALDQTDDFPNRIQSALDYLSISNKKREEIENSVKLEVEKYGEGFINDKYTYSSESDVISISGDDIELCEEETMYSRSVIAESADDTAPAELSDEVITSIVQIKPGETKQYRYKRLSIKAYINCEGALEFDHCVISYNEL